MIATPGSSANAPAAAPLLDVRKIGIAFGGLKAVQEFSLSLPDRALYGLIGPNGAGKTTVFNLLTGVYRPDSGEMSLAGQNLRGKRPEAITAAGLARTFQNIRLFGELSVLDNVRLACQVRGRHALWQTIVRTKGYLAQEAHYRKKALALLALFDLTSLADEPANSLCYGHQRRLEILRALATEPKVLLLDEPAAGMNPQEKRELAESIRNIRDRFQVAVLLIEHDMGLVMEICERITVLDQGQIISEGTPEKVQNCPRVITAYLGVGGDKEVMK